MESRNAVITIDVDCMHGHIDLSSGKPAKYPRDEHYIKASYEFWLPRFLDVLGELDIKATFFLVADFVRGPYCSGSLRRIIDEGHEVASHTLTHRIDLCMADKVDKRKELLESKMILEDLTGGEVKGFRGPGYAIDKDLLELLADIGYGYDSSVVPGYLFAFYKWFSWYLEIIKGREPLLYPNRPPHRSKRPFLYEAVSGARIVELPINVLPVFPVPFVSYIIRNRKQFSWLYGMIKSAPVLIHQFHDFEFLDCTRSHEYLKTTATLKVCRKGLKDRLDLFRFELSEIKSDYRISLAGEIAKKYNS